MRVIVVIEIDVLKIKGDSLEKTYVPSMSS